MIDLPQIDPRDEDALVAAAIDALPEELSDRNASSDAVKLIEAVGAFYGMLGKLASALLLSIRIYILSWLGLEPTPATYATGQVTFRRTSTGSAILIPAGTTVRTSTSSSALRFKTDVDVTMGAGATAVGAAVTAIVTGAAGNVGAGTVLHIETPVAGIETVSNSAPFTGGQDVEPLDSLIARAPLAKRASERAVTAEDFVYHTELVAGVERAVAWSAYPGNMSLNLTATDLNESGPSLVIILSVLDVLRGKVTPGLAISLYQPAVRGVRIMTVDVQLDEGYSQVTTAMNVALNNVLAEWVTALDIYDSAGTLTSPGWRHGRALWFSEFNERVGAIEGIRVIESVTYRTTDNYGSSWTTTQQLANSPIETADERTLLHLAVGWPGYGAAIFSEV
jgi:hypothetical protein